MQVIDGNWYMNGVDWNDEGCIHTDEELLEVIGKVGFLLLFDNDIPGFSVENMTDASCWWNGDAETDPWEWRITLSRTGKVAYGKFFGNKAGFISKKWFPYFANFRRDGYDFDARYEDGLASFDDKELYELLDANAPILSRPLKRMGNYRKGGRKGFDSAITRLQKQCYVLISDFRYAEDKFGNEYGWGIAEYSTPEKFFGRKFTDKVYNRTPEESYDRLFRQLKKILPGVEDKQLKKILSV